MGWTTPLKYLQMILASITLLLATYGAVGFEVHSGYAIAWFCFGWTLVFTTIRVMHHNYDSRGWRIISLGLEVTNTILWAVTTGLLAKDATWLTDGKNRHGNFSDTDPRRLYPYYGYGLAALYVTYAAIATSGIIAIMFMLTTYENVRKWKSPIRGLDEKDPRRPGEIAPLRQYDQNKNISDDSTDVREV